MREADRGQLSLPVIEAAIGVVLVLAVVVGFTLGVPHPDGTERQLDAYAHDAATVLAEEPPRHGGATRLEEVSASAARFERERAALEARLTRVLPANCMFRVTTPHGTVGYPRPAGVPVGEATVPTAGGPVTLEVWYV
ncbi:hypothetical protein EFA46_005670 [Halarchaeum sp. CBA1220]|uniref:DUF7262 family protein n=1 Tax=Halarchaeum sp. CBA1220 TaxID=1853682 RepID=UPI000F3A8683|nr:hypothetical protein [Halarchaeum sp. CBA1220]QLC33707.1 hypothetical protein EFA46_005670 [Halarchaeum sp. CBA1220]